MRKIYLVLGGYVIAKDGQKHYVKAQELIRLYGVDSGICVVAEAMNPETVEYITSRNKYLIVLKPRSDGNYKLPAESTKGGEKTL